MELSLSSQRHLEKMQVSNIFLIDSSLSKNAISNCRREGHQAMAGRAREAMGLLPLKTVTSWAAETMGNAFSERTHWHLLTHLEIS